LHPSNLQYIFSTIVVNPEFCTYIRHDPVAHGYGIVWPLALLLRTVARKRVWRELGVVRPPFFAAAATPASPQETSQSTE